jgi:flagellar hook assembly protein FlgD
MPNPTTGPASFRVSLEERAPLSIRICDVAGRTVRTLELGAGEGAVDWDGQATDGSHVPSGVYYYQVLGGSEVLGGGSLVIAR